MKTKTKLVTVEQTIYVAKDGKEFADEDDCLKYENSCIGENLQMYSYTLLKTYNVGCCRYAKIDTPEQVTDFITLCRYHGVSIRGIEAPGIYIYVEGTYGDRETAWINVSRAIEIMEAGAIKIMEAGGKPRT